MRKTLLCLTVLCLTGCYSMAHLEDPISAEQGIECEYDNFAKTNICNGRHIVSKAQDLTSPSANSYLSIDLAQQDLSPKLIIRVNQTNNWTFPKQVIDSNGQKFATTQIDSQIPVCYSGVCMTWEYISVNLTMNYLRQHADTGFSMKTYGIRGNVIIEVPAAYVQGFLNYIDKHKAI